MTDHFFARRSPRKFTLGLMTALSILLATSWVQAQAAARPASAAGSSAKAKHQTAAQPATKRPLSRRTHRRVAAEPVSNGMKMGLRDTEDELSLKSSAALVVDQDTGETLVLKNPDVVLPIASLTKLMTALVVLESSPPMDEVLEIGSDDVDTFRNTHSRLKVGTRLTRSEMLLLALMSSENRAAMTLSSHYPGGRAAFIERMNLKAQALGMTSTHFADPAGLSNETVSTARDLYRMLTAADAQPLIRSFTTQAESTVEANGHPLTYVSSNQLVRAAGDWDIELQKTGFTNEAGRCLVMQTTVLSRRLAMIFLDSTGTLTRYADAARVRKRLEIAAKDLLPRQSETAAPSASSSLKLTSKLLH